MPGIFRAIGDELSSRLRQKDTAPVNTFEGFQSNGAVVVRDRRGTVKAEIPDAKGKGFAGGSDPLAIYKPTGAKEVDAAKAMRPSRTGASPPSTPSRANVPTYNSGCTK